MTNYNSERLHLVRSWIKLVESKRQTIRNVMGYAKKVYDATEEMGTWDDLKEEVNTAKEKLIKNTDAINRNNALKDCEMEKIRKEKEEKIRILKSIPTDKYEQLKAKVILDFKNNPKMAFMLKNFNPDKGLGKVFVETAIIKAFKDETRT